MTTLSEESYKFYMRAPYWEAIDAAFIAAQVEPMTVSNQDVIQAYKEGGNFSDEIRKVAQQYMRLILAKENPNNEFLKIIPVKITTESKLRQYSNMFTDFFEIKYIDVPVIRYRLNIDTRYHSQGSQNPTRKKPGSYRMLTFDPESFIAWIKREGWAFPDHETPPIHQQEDIVQNIDYSTISEKERAILAKQLIASKTTRRAVAMIVFKHEYKEGSKYKDGSNIEYLMKKVDGLLKK